MTRFQFTDDEYCKLSCATGFSIMDLKKMDAMGLLSNETAVKLVMKEEFRRAQKNTKALSKLVVFAIANKYGWPVKKVRAVLYDSKRAVYYCQECNKQMTRQEFVDNDGICNECAMRKITL